MPRDGHEMYGYYSTVNTINTDGWYTVIDLEHIKKNSNDESNYWNTITLGENPIKEKPKKKPNSNIIFVPVEQKKRKK
jgi:hypothetical protein